MKNVHLGFTLIELMITIAILALITAIAIPAYNGYVREAKFGAARSNIDTLRISLEDWRLEKGHYQVNGASFDPEAEVQLGWAPDGDNDAYSYQVVNASTNSYTINVTFSGGWLRCEDRMNKCCDGTSGTPSACP